ncbi:hypothetical protein [Arthrobacter sp. AQ5-05]|uniref:hypothetical protein n=1 Tax=Arthrobacter sp. AQ5-05 TaxID=2184581 RepID=UPI0018A7A598|nr:hypothetical protein [Arthrobacter sp. AQ5-05]
MIEPLEFLPLKFDDERTFGSVVVTFDGIGGAVSSPASKTQSAVSAARTHPPNAPRAGKSNSILGMQGPAALQTRTDSPVHRRGGPGACSALDPPLAATRVTLRGSKAGFKRPRSNVSDC